MAAVSVKRSIKTFVQTKLKAKRLYIFALLNNTVYDQLLAPCYLMKRKCLEST